MKYVCGTILVVAGLVAIHFGVEHSGWAIVIGALVMLG